MNRRFLTDDQQRELARQDSEWGELEAALTAMGDLAVPLPEEWTAKLNQLATDNEPRPVHAIRA